MNTRTQTFIVIIPRLFQNSTKPVYSSLNLDATNESLIKILNAPSVNSSLKPGEASLGDRIKNHDDAYVVHDWAKAYSFRSSRWQHLVSTELWTKEMLASDYDLDAILTLGASPIPSSVAPASAFQIEKLGVLRNKADAGNQYIFYSELWIMEDGKWVSAGGARWDNPAPLLLKLTSE
jgi:hypothetical protein